MQKIRLSRGKFALVDDEDFEWLSKWKWYAAPQSGKWKAQSSQWSKEKKKQITVLMHRLLMKPKDLEEVDHRDRNPLNNQKENLRVCTGTENKRNIPKRKDNTTGFRGVYRQNGKWSAKINHNWKAHFLGYFPTKQAAALAYNKAATVFHGEFAQLNAL